MRLWACRHREAAKPITVTTRKRTTTTTSSTTLMPSMSALPVRRVGVARDGVPGGLPLGGGPAGHPVDDYSRQHAERNEQQLQPVEARPAADGGFGRVVQ